MGSLNGISNSFSFSFTAQATMSSAIKLFLVGDVMLARGVDMIQDFSCDPRLYEGNGLSARDYVELAVMQNGPIPEKSKRGPSYVWGDALKILDKQSPDVRIINLENSVTQSDDPWPLKGIHYRMHPKNVNVIQAAKIDCCILANNHTADWGFAGLEETLHTLQGAGVAYAGAGFTLEEAQAPAMFPVPGKGRVLVFAVGHPSSGVPERWKAKAKHCGVNVVDLRPADVSALSQKVKGVKRSGDIAVLSIHWGGNWGYEIEPPFQNFAHNVIDKADIDVVFGHSSHHAMGIEVYNRKLIIYGAGDFLNDYEGITGHESYRGDLSLMYFPSMDPTTGHLVDLTMIPTRIRHLRVQHACADDVHWMYQTMTRECKKLGSTVKRHEDELHYVLK